MQSVGRHPRAASPSALVLPLAGLALLAGASLVGCGLADGSAPLPLPERVRVRDVVAVARTAEAAPSEKPGGDVAVFAAPAAVSPGTVSGERLVLRQIEAADGAVQPLGWLDKRLRVECSFRKGSDGHMRCLPLHTALIEERGYFMDASCSEPLVVAADGCTPTPFAERLERPSRCGGGQPGVSIYEVGQRSTAKTVFVQGDDACKAVPAPPGVDLYKTSAMPPDRFVFARIVTP